LRLRLRIRMARNESVLLRRVMTVLGAIVSTLHGIRFHC
jgi:hypothetical protein